MNNSENPENQEPQAKQIAVHQAELPGHGAAEDGNVHNPAPSPDSSGRQTNGRYLTVRDLGMIFLGFITSIIVMLIFAPITFPAAFVLFPCSFVYIWWNKRKIPPLLCGVLWGVLLILLVCGGIISIYYLHFGRL